MNTAEQTKWIIDKSHSEISFSVRHLMITKVRGSFKDYNASIYTTGKDFTTAVVDLWIDVTTIFTGDKERDNHLIGIDFFDAARYKQITFVSSTIGAPNGNNMYELWGELTMRGITKNLKLDLEYTGAVKDPWGNEKVGLSITGKLNRSEWDLVWNTPLESGGLLVGEEITLNCQLELKDIGAATATPIMDLEQL